MDEGLSFTLLGSRVDITCQDPEAAKTLEYLPVNAQQDFSVRHSMTYSVTGNGPYRIAEQGDFLAEVATADDVLFVVYGRVHRRILERAVLSNWVVFHGALATVSGCRILLLGDKGSGKTTLTTCLMFRGHAVEGDEMVLARGGRVMAFPRRFHFKPGIERHAPQLQGRIGELPTKKMGDEDLSAFDPCLFGFDWRIDRSPIDTVIWISPNHGGETRLDPLESFAAIQKILESSLGWGEQRTNLVGEATRLGKSGGYQLLLGDPDSAIALLENIAGP